MGEMGKKAHDAASVAGRGELVIGLAGPLGTRLEDLSTELSRTLGLFQFGTTTVRLSALLRRFPQWRNQQKKGEGERIAHLQRVANDVRAGNKDGGIVARAAIAAIRERRLELTGDLDRPAHGHAFIVSQLKHPDEVELLRRTYGPSFLFVAGHATPSRRNKHLANVIATSCGQPGAQRKFLGLAADLIDADQRSSPDYGQNMQDTFPLADMFVDMNHDHGETAVGRYLELEFGHPFHTPTPDEYAMYQASSVALRSSDFNRQVGAAIVQLDAAEGGQVLNADILALGMNEVPKRGGGYYWDSESPDHRDQALRGEPASEIKLSILTELLERIAKEGMLTPSASEQEPDDLASALLPALERTQFVNIGEFSRPVHAEVAAIIDAARRGVRIDGSSIYVTTFPCHNCAKHIIATGIAKVVYLEPYPKSRADNLYGEEIALDTAELARHETRIPFEVYSGVAPRKYRTLFSMAERGAKQGLSREKWQASRAILRPLHVPLFIHASTNQAEVTEVESLERAGYT